MKNANVLVLALTAATLLGNTLPAAAGFVGTEQMATQETRAATLSQVEGFLAGKAVESQLLEWGVPPEQVRERIQALSDQELQQLASTLQNDPAGGILTAVGVVFVILLILELTGVTNIFRSV